MFSIVFFNAFLDEGVAVRSNAAVRCLLHALRCFLDTFFHFNPISAHETIFVGKTDQMGHWWDVGTTTIDSHWRFLLTATILRAFFCCLFRCLSQAKRRCWAAFWCRSTRATTAGVLVTSFSARPLAIARRFATPTARLFAVCWLFRQPLLISVQMQDITDVAQRAQATDARDSGGRLGPASRAASRFWFFFLFFGSSARARRRAVSRHSADSWYWRLGGRRALSDAVVPRTQICPICRSLVCRARRATC